MDVIERYKIEYASVIRGPVAPSTVDSILGPYGVKNKIYRRWLIETGGGPIGPDWYDGVDELNSSQDKLKSESWNLSGFVIGWDGAGNPIALDASGTIVTEDHNFGGIHTLARGFDELLAQNVSS